MTNLQTIKEELMDKNKILKNLEEYNKYLLEWEKDKTFNKLLRIVFETEEDEKKFYYLAENYMYAWFEATLEECEENLSKEAKKRREEKKLEVKKKERENRIRDKTRRG